MDLQFSPYWRAVLLFLQSKAFIFSSPHTEGLKLLGENFFCLLNAEKLAAVIRCCKLTSACRVKMLINIPCAKCAGAFRSTADLTQILNIDGYHIRHRCQVL